MHADAQARMHGKLHAPGMVRHAQSSHDGRGVVAEAVALQDMHSACNTRASAQRSVLGSNALYTHPYRNPPMAANAATSSTVLLSACGLAFESATACMSMCLRDRCALLLRNNQVRVVEC